LNSLRYASCSLVGVGPINPYSVSRISCIFDCSVTYCILAQLAELFM